MPWYVLSGVYLIIWSALLIHCLLQRRFYPVFGRGRGTKIFWLLTFIFLNPLLTFLYFVFGFLLRDACSMGVPPMIPITGNPRFRGGDVIPAKAGMPVLRPAKGAPPGSPVTFGSVAAIAFVAFVLALFEWPFPDHRAEPVVLRAQEPKIADCRLQGQDALATSQIENLLPLGQAHVALVKAKNGVQTFGSTSAESDDRASVRSIVLICQNPAPLLDLVTRKFQEALIGLAEVEKVAYYPYGSWPEPGGSLPDVFITVDILELQEKAFLCNRRLRATIQWQVSDTLFPGSVRANHPNAPPTVAFDMESRLDHDSTMIGIESPRSMYKIEAEGIAAELSKSVSKQFGNLLDKYGQMPRVPAALRGAYREPPEFAFLKECNAERLICAGGILEDNHTTWRFLEPRRIDEALTAYRDQLHRAGWGSEVSAKDYLRMQKANEHIYIFRDRRQDSSVAAIELGGSLKADGFGDDRRQMNHPQAPQGVPQGLPLEAATGRVAGKPSSNVMVAHYESYFTSDRIQEAMDVLLASDAPTKTLLAFERYLRTPEQAERLRAAIEASTLCTMDGFLMLGRYWADRGQRDKALESLMRARAMQRAEKQRDARARAIRTLAEKLGDQSLAETSLSEQVFRDVGFVDAGRLTGPLELEKALDEPVLLCRRLDDGSLRTIALRVVHSRDVASPGRYGLLAIDRRRGSPNTTETTGTAGPDGSWTAEFSAQGSAVENESIRATVKSIGGGRFLFVVHP